MNVLFAWMSDLGIRFDDHEPDARQLAHMASVRDARHAASRGSSRFTRLVARIGLAPIPATTAQTCACPA